MIIVMKDQATEKQIDEVIGWIESVGYKAHPSRGVERTIIGAVGDNRDKAILKYAESLPGVEKTMPILKPYKLASRESHEGDSVVNVGGISIGGPDFVVMAGPCSIESEEQLMESAYVVKKGGAQILRGGAYKPRTSPYSFQGMEEEGLKLLEKVRLRTSMPVVTEVVNPVDVDLVESYADMLQIGARNMRNYELLKAAGRAGAPVILKRAPGAPLRDWLLSAEYLLKYGDGRVVLCERGDSFGRGGLDLKLMERAMKATALPVIADPSHACGRREQVAAQALAAARAGADGVMIEAAADPSAALVDGRQTLGLKDFSALAKKLRALRK